MAIDPNPLLAASIPAVWLDAIWPYLLMVLGFSLIIFVHELGHFLAAKWAGVRVDRFAIGFGRELFGFTMGETRYSFNLLPFGGYVKMLGQEDFDDKFNELKFTDDPRSFPNKPVGHRMVIVSAGVVMNLILAFLIFIVVFMVGLETIGTRVGSLLPGSPGERAGLQPGDRIHSINGTRMHEWNDIQARVALAPPHEKIEIVVERNGELLAPLYVEPEHDPDVGRLYVGITPGFTRQIVVVGPEIDITRPDRPRPSDLLAEVDGRQVTDDNVNEILSLLPAVQGEIIVERPDPADPNAPPARVQVEAPPRLMLSPSDPLDESSANVLGLRPLMRFAAIEPKGRAELAGMQVGDVILSFADVRYPNMTELTRAIRDNPERDLYFESLTPKGEPRKGFVRPRSQPKGQGTIQASVVELVSEDGENSGRRLVFDYVLQGGAAHRAGVHLGDVIVEWDGNQTPPRNYVNNSISRNVGRLIQLTVRTSNGTEYQGNVTPIAPGAIQASYGLVADELLRVGGIVATLNGQPSPALEAGIPRGALIASVDGQPVRTWRELISRFRENAGGSVKLVYLDEKKQPHEVDFAVPHTIHTLLGIGPEGRILSIDGRSTVSIETARKIEEVSVGYYLGTRTAIEQAADRQSVKVTFRRNLFAPVESAVIAIPTDAIDPWLGRVALVPNVLTSYQLGMLKAQGPIDAVAIGIHKTHSFVLQAYTFLNRMIFSRSVSADNLAGPLGIIDMGGQVARAGFVKFLFFLAMLSANLAVINFLPLPIMDGGVMVFLLIEKIKGGPVSLRVQVATQMIGLFLIVGIFLYATFNDALRLWG